MKLTPEQLKDMEKRTRLRAHELTALAEVLDLAGIAYSLEQLEELANYGLHVIDFPQDIVRAARAAAQRAAAREPPTKERQCN